MREAHGGDWEMGGRWWKDGGRGVYLAGPVQHGLKDVVVAVVERGEAAVRKRVLLAGKEVALFDVVAIR